MNTLSYSLPQHRSAGFFIVHFNISNIDENDEGGTK